MVHEGSQGWVHHAAGGQILTLNYAVIEPGEVTTDFDPDDPLVQRMLTAHPELRPIVTLSRWELLRRPAF